MILPVLVQVSYDSSTQKLSVFVVECQGLKKTDLFGKSDPFVKLFLLPGAHTEIKTKVIKKTLNPVFNEEFHLKVRHVF